jgi:sigma-70-like protein
VRAAEEHEYTEYVTARLPALRRLAYQLVGDAHRADDVVQVAITRLYQHWGKARAATDLDAYVRKIVPLRFCPAPGDQSALRSLMGGRSGIKAHFDPRGLRSD